MKILAFSGSNSPTSINQQLVQYAARHLHHPVQLLSLRDYPLPLFSVEHLEKHGVPDPASELLRIIKRHDAFIIAVPEHNHSVPAAFKNAMDWVSRAGDDYFIFDDKPILLIGTSPGGGGARSALQHAGTILETLRGKVAGVFPLASFHHHATLNDEGIVIHDESLRKDLDDFLHAFERRLGISRSRTKTNEPCL